jgi:hypothetical protein
MSIKINLNKREDFIQSSNLIYSSELFTKDDFKKYDLNQINTYVSELSNRILSKFNAAIENNRIRKDSLDIIENCITMVSFVTSLKFKYEFYDNSLDDLKQQLTKIYFGLSHILAKKLYKSNLFENKFMFHSYIDLQAGIAFSSIYINAFKDLSDIDKFLFIKKIEENIFKDWATNFVKIYCNTREFLYTNYEVNSSSIENLKLIIFNDLDFSFYNSCIEKLNINSDKLNYKEFIEIVKYSLEDEFKYIQSLNNFSSTPIDVMKGYIRRQIIDYIEDRINDDYIENNKVENLVINLKLMLEKKYIENIENVNLNTAELTLKEYSEISERIIEEIVDSYLSY